MTKKKWHPQERVCMGIVYILGVILYCWCMPASSVGLPLGTSLGQRSIFYGSIRLPQSVVSLPSISSLTLPPLFYKGREYNIDIDVQGKKVSYEIYEQRFCREFYIAVTTDLKKPCANVACLELTDHAKHKLYHIRRVLQKNSDDDSSEVPSSPLLYKECWEIVEVPPHDEQKKLPDHTIIFFMDPDFIDLQPTCWHVDDAFIPLPVIVFKEDVSEKALHEMGVKMVCVALDFKCIHKRETKTTTLFSQNRSVAIPNPLNRYLLYS